MSAPRPLSMRLQKLDEILRMLGTDLRSTPTRKLSGVMSGVMRRGAWAQRVRDAMGARTRGAP